MGMDWNDDKVDQLRGDINIVVTNLEAIVESIDNEDDYDDIAEIVSDVHTQIDRLREAVRGVN